VGSGTTRARSRARQIPNRLQPLDQVRVEFSGDAQTFVGYSRHRQRQACAVDLGDQERQARQAEQHQAAERDGRGHVRCGSKSDVPDALDPRRASDRQDRRDPPPFQQQRTDQHAQQSDRRAETDRRVAQAGLQGRGPAVQPARTEVTELQKEDAGAGRGDGRPGPRIGVDATEALDQVDRDQGRGDDHHDGAGAARGEVDSVERHASSALAVDHRGSPEW
jgi:hypothetical protein